MNTLLNYDFTIVWYSLHQFGMSWSFFSRASIECEFNGGLASAANKVFLFGTSLLIDPVWHGDQERSFHIRLHRVACQGEFQASLLSTHLAKQLMPPGSTPTARPSPWNCRHLIRGYIKLQIFTWLILIAKLHLFTHWNWLSAKLWAPLNPRISDVEAAHLEAFESILKYPSSLGSIWSVEKAGEDALSATGKNHGTPHRCHVMPIGRLDEPLKRLLVINCSSLRVGNDSIGFHVT